VPIQIAREYREIYDIAGIVVENEPQAQKPSVAEIIQDSRD
jgi:hypothetical protein